MADKQRPRTPNAVTNQVVHLSVPNGMRLGQAIIVALEKSGDLHQEVWESPSDPTTNPELEYKVTGIDLFYMDDEELQKRINKL